MRHELDPSNIDEKDEVSDANQLVYIWCNRHQKYEWHNLPIASQRSSEVINLDGDPLWA